MTRFDAELFGRQVPATESPSALTLVADQPAVALTSIVLASLAVCLASTLLLFGQVLQLELGRTMDAVQLSVFLQPQLSRTDAEALRRRIEAIPAVASATLRPREDALAALIKSGLPAIPAKPNPLPDVWIVAMRPATPDEAAAPLSARIETVRQPLVGIPGVESVRVDGSWVASLDRWSVIVRRGAAWVDGLAAGGLLVALFAVFFLAGRGYRGGCEGRSNRSGVQALASVGIVSTSIAFVLTCAVITLAAALFPAVGSGWKPALAAIDWAGQALIVATGVLAIVTAAVAAAWGGSR